MLVSVAEVVAVAKVFVAPRGSAIVQCSLPDGDANKKVTLAQPSLSEGSQGSGPRWHRNGPNKELAPLAFELRAKQWHSAQSQQASGFEPSDASKFHVSNADVCVIFTHALKWRMRMNML